MKNETLITLKTFILLKILCLYPFIFTCLLKPDGKTHPMNFQIHSIDTSLYAIINFDPEIHYMFDKAYKKALLTDLDIKNIQVLLKKSVEDYNSAVLRDTSYKGSKSRLLELSIYKRQLIPITNTKGEKEVLVSCICTTDIPILYKSGINWKEDYFKVNDGGKCYFHVFLNLTTKQYYSFSVNGRGT